MNRLSLRRRFRLWLASKNWFKASLLFCLTWFELFVFVVVVWMRFKMNEI